MFDEGPSRYVRHTFPEYSITDTRQEELTIKLGAWSNLNQMTTSLTIMTSDNLTID
jgi:hypothetical protein